MPERDRREASLADAKLRMLRVIEILAAWEDWGPPGGGGRAIRVRVPWRHEIFRTGPNRCRGLCARRWRARGYVPTERITHGKNVARP